MMEEDDDRAADDPTDLWTSDAGCEDAADVAEADFAERECGRGAAPAADVARRERDAYLGFLSDMLGVFALKLAFGLPALRAFWVAGNLPKGMRFLGLEATTMANVDLTFTSHSHHYDDDHGGDGLGLYGLGEPVVLWGLDQGAALAVRANDPLSPLLLRFNFLSSSSQSYVQAAAMRCAQSTSSS